MLVTKGSPYLSNSKPSSLIPNEDESLGDALPNEMWLYIFSFLPPTVLATASLVCKAWRPLCNDNFIWKKLYFRDYGEPTLDVDCWKSAYEVQYINKNAPDESYLSSDGQNNVQFLQAPPNTNTHVETIIDGSYLITGLAITILGALAIAGIVGPYLGWIALGFGGALGILALFGFRSCNSRCSLFIPALYFIVIGALGGAGLLSSVGIGWFTIGPALFCGTTLACLSYGAYSTSSCWMPVLCM